MIGVQPAATASKKRRLDSVSPRGQKQNLLDRPTEAPVGSSFVDNIFFLIARKYTNTESVPVRGITTVDGGCRSTEASISSSSIKSFCIVFQEMFVRMSNHRDTAHLR